MKRENFFNSIPEGQCDVAKEMYIRNSFRRIFISGIVFLFISVLSLTNDLIYGFYDRPDQPFNRLNLFALIILGCGSAVMVFLGFVDSKKPLPLSICSRCHAAFYIIINISMILIMFNEFYRGYFVSYIQFYWIFFSAVPLFHLRYNILNAVIDIIVFSSEFIYVMCLGKITPFDFAYFIPVLLSFCLFGLYLRGYYLQTIIFTLTNHRLNEQLRYRSSLDPLTGCLNRYVLHERFETLRENAGCLTAMMFDIDFFKQYNDGFSHLKGDECLGKISECVGKLCEDKNASLFRYGGEEFVVFATGMSEKDTKKFALQIIDSIADLEIPMPERFSETSSVVTVSLGAGYLSVNSETDLKTVISEIDSQLYLAKENGKNCVFYHNEKVNSLRSSQLSFDD